MQVYSTDIIEHSGLKYRIEMRQDRGVWMQRHIWYPAPATYCTSQSAEPWIRSIGGPSAKMHPVKAPAKSRAPQKPCDVGLFSDDTNQLDLIEQIRRVK